MASITELTRLLAAIHTWQDGHGKPGEAARRLDEAHKLLDGVANVLGEVRREAFRVRTIAMGPKE